MSLKNRALSVAASLALATTAVVGISSQASADTRGYGNLSIDRIGNVYFNFGIPQWVTANTASRSVAKGACASYLGSQLGLRWWLWWAPDIACGYVVDRIWKPNSGTAACGQVPLANVWATRVWAC
jgi:hypothetical protein